MFIWCLKNIVSCSEKHPCARSSPGPSSASTPGSPVSPRVPPDKDVLKLMTRVLRKMEEVAKTHSERLKFLDPELESTNTRIEVLEALCKANETKISGLTKVSFINLSYKCYTWTWSPASCTHQAVLPSSGQACPCQGAPPRCHCNSRHPGLFIVRFEGILLKMLLFQKQSLPVQNILEVVFDRRASMAQSAWHSSLTWSLRVRISLQLSWLAPISLIEIYYWLYCTTSLVLIRPQEGVDNKQIKHLLKFRWAG